VTAAPLQAGDDSAWFEEPVRDIPDSLHVDVDGYEGPLDLLLKLARDQKVDLTKISVLALAEQYLAFIDEARRLSLEIAADYLVMAAWLAFLKSRLLLPAEEDDEPSGEELAEVLAQRLRRLEAMRAAGRRLLALPRLGMDIFARGMPEPTIVHTDIRWEAKLYDLLSSYAALRLHRIAGKVEVPRRDVFTLQDARDRLVALIGTSVHWAPLDSYLLDYLRRPELRRTARASALSASLELVREGEVELRQSAPFAPLYIRRRFAEARPLAKVANG
jgi:segregation and condensation protein A